MEKGAATVGAGRGSFRCTYSLFHMQARLPLLLLPAAALLPLCGHAQTTPARFYVGLGVASSLLRSPDGFTGTPVTPTTHNDAPVLPQLTVGWRLAPRLALQLGGQYAQQRSTYDFVQSRPNATGQPTTYLGFSSFRFRSMAVPVLLRYTLTGSPAHRVQLDALGGVTLVRRWTQYHTLRLVSAPDSTQPDYILDTETATATTNVHAALGLGVRCRLARHLEATADLLANYQLNESAQPVIGNISFTTASRLAPIGSVGINYLVGR